MKTESAVLALLGCFGVIGVAVVLSIFNPLLFALGGYFTGWLLSSVFGFAGEWIVTGAKYLGFDFPVTALPVIGAALAFFGAFFKATQTNSNTSK